METRNLVVNMARLRVGPARARAGLLLAREAIAHGAMQKRSELAPFLAVLLEEERPHCLIEIGRGSGGSLRAWCRAASDDATIVSIDLPGGPYGGSEADAETLARYRSYARPGQQLHLVQGDSRDPETVSTVRKVAQDADVLFIDGDHTYNGVASDFSLYRDRVKRGGVIAFHDILHHNMDKSCEVDRFWSELPGKRVEIVSRGELNRWGGEWGGIGFIRV